MECVKCGGREEGDKGTRRREGGKEEREEGKEIKTLW